MAYELRSDSSLWSSAADGSDAKCDVLGNQGTSIGYQAQVQIMQFKTGWCLVTKYRIKEGAVCHNKHLRYRPPPTRYTRCEIPELYRYFPSASTYSSLWCLHREPGLGLYRFYGNVLRPLARVVVFGFRALNVVYLIISVGCFYPNGYVARLFEKWWFLLTTFYSFRVFYKRAQPAYCTDPTQSPSLPSSLIRNRIYTFRRPHGDL